MRTKLLQSGKLLSSYCQVYVIVGCLGGSLSSFSQTSFALVRLLDSQVYCSKKSKSNRHVLLSSVISPFFLLACTFLYNSRHCLLLADDCIVHVLLKRLEGIVVFPISLICRRISGAIFKLTF